MNQFIQHSTPNQADYINGYFEFPILDKIHGEPNYKSLKTLKKQLKANAQCIPSELGGGNHGHLVLVLSPQEYTQVSNTAYVRPVHPGQYVPQPGLFQHEAMRLHLEHMERHRVFKEANNVEKALIKQIVAAIDAEYLKALRNTTTNTINLTIPDLLAYLFSTYGYVAPSEVDEEEQKLKTFYWNPYDPPVLMFNAIEDFESLAAAANLPRPEAVIINYGISLIQKTGDYERALLDWFNKTAADKTWVNFKQHFTTAQTELKRVRGPTMRNTPFHQANQMAEHLTHRFDNLKADLMATLQDIATPTEQESVPPPAPSMHATANHNKVVMDMIEELCQEIRDSKKAAPKKRKYKRTTINKYCWSHGACAHWGKDCRDKKPGHKDEATFKDKMGGSTEMCKECE